jgi:alpha-tubulin suppressor-like RCC1 family protein
MILGFGSNSFGQLGLGNKVVRDNKYSPVEFGKSDETECNVEEVEDIACGSQFTVVLYKNGNAEMCGMLNGLVMPVLCPVEVAYPLKLTQIACGRKHILGLLQGGFIVR